MLYNALQFVHVLSIIVWVGGMVFAHFFLRPAAQALEPPLRVRLMHDVLQRFLGALGVPGERTRQGREVGFDAVLELYVDDEGEVWSGGRVVTVLRGMLDW